MSESKGSRALFRLQFLLHTGLCKGLAYRSQYVLKALQVFVAVEAGEFCVALHVREASRKLAGCCG